MLLFIFLSAFFICIYPTLSTISFLSKPTNLRVSYSADPTLVNIVWSSPEESEGKITGYIILYTDDSLLNDIKWKREKVFEQQKTFFLTQLTPDSKYFLKIKPIIDGNQFGPPSDVIKFMTKPFSLSLSFFTPKILKVVGKDSSMVEITWTSQITKAIVIRYEIYYTSGEMKQSPKWNKKFIGKEHGFHYINNASIYNLVPNTNYKFVIKVITYGNNQDWISSVFDFRTAPLITKNYISSLLILFITIIICLYARSFLYFIYFFIKSVIEGERKQTENKRTKPETKTESESETERKRRQNNNETKIKKFLIIQLLTQATYFMSRGSFEDAVRVYERIYFLEPSIENKRLLESAKMKLEISKKKDYKDYYKLLGVTKTVSMEELKKAYRDLALIHHPDKYSHASEGKKKEQERLMKDINQAYDVLKDPIKRYDYNIKRCNNI